MTPYKQLNEHDPDEGLYGDCWRTAIGCLLDLSPSSIPDFVGTSVEDDGWFERTNNWLIENHNLVLFSVYYDAGWSVDDVLEFMEQHNPDTPYILGGMSPADVEHVVIGRGGKLIHDPGMGESEPEITGPNRDGQIWIFALTPYSPRKEISDEPSCRRR